MKMFKKILSAVTASAVTLSMAAGSAAMFSTVTAADIDSMTAVELVEDMGTGWNLGNSFDSTNTWDNPLTIEKLETAWGNPVTTQSIIDSVAFYGFNTVRIPVTWMQMTNNGVINEEYLARIKEVVDYCYANDMYVIINMHHDGLSGNWLYNGTGAKDQFTKMWTQIASYFKDYDRHLAFEGWNEIDWDYGTIQTMGQAFVDAVRSAGGDYNDDRLLIIPGKNTNIANTLNSGYVLPTDPANMLAVDVHFYDPTIFTVCTSDDGWGPPVSTWGSDAEIAEAKNLVAQLEDRFVDNGVGVILGEYGVENAEKEEASRILYTKTVASNAMAANGVCACLWDSGGEQGKVGNMQYFDRYSQTWLNSEMAEFYKELSGGTYVKDDLILTDRVTLTGTVEDGTVLVDLKQFKDTAAVLKEAIWSVTVENLTSAGYYGQVAVQANVTDEVGSGNDSWAYNPVSIANESDIYTTDLNSGWNYNDADGKGTLYDMEVYSLVYDYLKLEKWFVGSDGTAPTVTINPEVTIVFEDAIWVTPDYQIPTEPTPTETEPVPTETEPVPTETDPVPTETEPVPTETEPVPTETEPVPTETEPAPAIAYGDVDGSGDVDIMDVIMLNKFLLGATDLDEQARLNADVDENGSPAAADSLNIMRYIVELITEFPV